MTTQNNTYAGITLRHRPLIFRSLDLAGNCAARDPKAVVMMGVVGEYVVVCMADAARMERAGFEFASL